MRHTLVILITGLWLCGAQSARAQAQNESAVAGEHDTKLFTDAAADAPEPSLKEQLLAALPPDVAKDLEIDAWGWLGGLHQPNGSDYWDLDLSLQITKSFNQRAVVSAQGNLISANGDWRAELRQGFLSTYVSQEHETILTAGKFNANFGVEPRDFWNRSTGTTSLLFGAQPQDIVGAMITQPLGDTTIKLRPFISADFQGDFYFDQSPSVGIKIDFQPHKNLKCSITNWVGPGFVLFGGEPLHDPYPAASYGESPEAVVANWQGPNFLAERASTLYFVDAKAVWQLYPDLTLSGEFLLGTTDSSTGTWGWHGWMAMATYDLTDRLHAYGRFSYLDDPHWLVTGFFQTRREVSVGFGMELMHDVEFRAEYRRDFSNAFDDVATISAHLSFTY